MFHSARSGKNFFRFLHINFSQMSPETIFNVTELINRNAISAKSARYCSEFERFVLQFILLKIERCFLSSCNNFLLRYSDGNRNKMP